MGHSDKHPPSSPPARKLTAQEATNILNAAFVTSLTPAEQGGEATMTSSRRKWTAGDSTARIAVEDLRKALPDVMKDGFVSIGILNKTFGNRMFTGSGLTNGQEPMSYMFNAGMVQQIAQGINPGAGNSIAP